MKEMNVVKDCMKNCVDCVISKDVKHHNAVDFYLKWLGTILILTGAAFTAFNFYPVNLYVHVAGSISWIVVGFIWKDYSIITLNGVLLGIVTLGILNYFLQFI